MCTITGYGTENIGLILVLVLEDFLLYMYSCACVISLYTHWGKHVSSGYSQIASISWDSSDGTQYCFHQTDLYRLYWVEQSIESLV
jgi:hypothetical protein